MSSEIESLTNHTCPNINTYNVEQETFFTGPFDDHKLGWIIAGVCAIVVSTEKKGEETRELIRKLYDCRLLFLLSLVLSCTVEIIGYQGNKNKS